MPIWRKCGCFRALSFGNRWKVISSRRQSAVRLPKVLQLRLAHFGHGTVLPWSAGGVSGFRAGSLAFACCCAELRVIFRWPCSRVGIQTSSHVSPVLAANSVFVASNTRSFVHLQSSSEERGRQETGTGPILQILGGATSRAGTRFTKISRSGTPLPNGSNTDSWRRVRLQRFGVMSGSGREL